MRGLRTTRRRWLAGSIAAMAGLVFAGSFATRGDAGWIGEAPPAEYHSPDRQFFLSADLDGAVEETLRDLLADIRQALDEAGVEVTGTRMKPPEYRIAFQDSLAADRVLQIVGQAIPGAKLEGAGAEIRVRLVDTILDRARRDIVLKIASQWQHGERIYLHEGLQRDFNIYVHESGCVRVDGIGRSEIPRRIMGAEPHMELVPLYPTLDADSDHLPPGFSRLRSERKVIKPTDPLPQGTSVLEALKRESKPVRIDPEDRWWHIVGGKPIVTNRHFVSAEIIPRLQGPAVSLRLDLVGQARAARLLPAFQGRQFGLILDNTVVGRFNTVTKADRGVTLWAELSDSDAEQLAYWLNGMAVPPKLEFTDACPATNGPG